MITNNTMNITIYSTPSCKYCILAKEYFKEKGLEYTEKDCTETNNRRELSLLSNQLSVPVIRIDNDVYIGFQKNLIEEKITSILEN